MDNSIPWTDSAQVGLVAGQLIVVIVAAVFAWRQVSEARELREQQIRPFVVVDFDVETDTNVYFQVSNLGASLARDVRIVIDPPLESAIDTDVGSLKMLTEGIATLAPGKVYRSFFDMGFRRAETDLPMNHVATVTYADETGRRHFKETLNLDLDQYMNMKFIQKRGVHDVYKELEQLRKILEKWTSGTGRGLLALSLDESRAETERRYAAMEERERQREAKGE